MDGGDYQWLREKGKQNSTSKFVGNKRSKGKKKEREGEVLEEIISGGKQTTGVRLRRGEETR